MVEEQIVAVLDTCSIVRKCFSGEVHYTYLMKRVTALNYVVTYRTCDHIPGLYTSKSPNITFQHVLV